MPRRKKILYTQTALRVCGLETDEKTVDLIIRVVRLVEYEQGKSDLQGLAAIVARNREKYGNKKEKEEPTKTEES